MPRASTLLVVCAVLLVCVWPPANERSLAVKLLNVSRFVLGYTSTMEGVLRALGAKHAETVSPEPT